MERKQSKKEEGKTYWGSKEGGDQRLGGEYALRICARQSENLKSKEGKSKENAQQEVYIGGAQCFTAKERETQRAFI